MSKRNIIFILLVGIYQLNFSQYSDIIFSRVTTENGLSSSWVRSIYQDDFGFIWFGTSDGLNRYDGNEIVVYRPNQMIRNTLISSAIDFIFEKENNKFWICTELGVCIFNRETNVFESFPMLENVRVVDGAIDSENNTWFSSNSGLYKYCPADSSMIIYRNNPADPSSVSSDLINVCYKDASGNMWFGTDKGLDLYIRDNKFMHFQPEGNKRGINGNHVSSIVQDHEGRIWTGISNLGLYLFQYHAETGQGSFLHVLDGSPNNLLMDNKNRLWVGNSLGLGLNTFDLISYKPLGKPLVKTYKNNHTDIHSLSDNTISCIFEDRDNGIWIGTFAGGVSYYASGGKKFHSVRHNPDDLNSLSNNVVNCFLEDHEFLWVGTEKGLNRFNKETGKVTKYFFVPAREGSLGADGVICMLKDSRGNLWIGTWNGGLNLYDYRQNIFKCFKNDNGRTGTLCSNHVFALLEDKAGNLWIGTDGGGLAQYHYETGSFSCLNHDPYKPESIFHNAVNDICQTSDGKIYVSVYHSLELFNPATKTFKHYTHNKFDTTSITAGNILDIFEDSKSNLWIATSGGLNYFDQKEERFVRYSVEDGLPNNTIQSIAEDDNGNLWLGSNKGLSKFINAISLPDTPVFINYSAEDGLQSNEFVRRSVMKSRTGQLYFGGSRGYTCFYADSITENSVKPSVVLIDFRIIDKQDPRGSIHNFGKEINLIDNITLSYFQSDFSIKYAALNYLNPSQNQYKYILEGYEKEWHEAGNQREAVYTNIDPGKYTFKVLGSNNDGIWSENPKTLDILITPPWWQTIVARILFVLLFFLLLYLLYRFRFKILEMQKAVLEEKVKERTTELSEVNSLLEEKQEEIILQNEELSKHRNHLESLVKERTIAMEAAIERAEASDKLKSAFLANMSHEIRTPMNAIVGFTSLLKNDDIEDSDRREFIEIISNNCEILMVLINDILDISLIEANQLKLNKSPFSADKILNELENYFRMSNNKDLKIEYVNKNNSNQLIISNDPTRFRQVFINLLNNALKYTYTGHVHFGYKKVDREVHFFVEDTGIGIDESEYQKIFQYFHKIDTSDNKLYRGAGIGLSISNKLVELMGGRIWLDSLVGKGTTFYFSLPPYHEQDITNEKQTIKSIKELQVRNLAGKLVLIAEDEPNNYVLIEKIIRPTKADVVWAKNGREAIEYIKKYSSTKEIIIIMDIKMPIMNGIHAAEEIKKIDERIPIIAVTAYAQKENKEEILKHNFRDYMAKPLQPLDLLQMIYKHINA